MEISYLKILKDSFKLAWKNRYLWWFGFMISLSSIGGTRYSFDARNETAQNTAFEKQLQDFVSQNAHWVIAGIAVLIAVCIVLGILSIISRGALIHSVEKHLKNEVSNFKTGFKKGKEKFWRVLAIALSTGLFMISSLIVLGAPVAFLFFNRNYIIGLFMGALAVLILIPLLILTAYLKTYGYIYAVSGNLQFWPALENAYNLFRKNIKSSIIMGLLFIPVGLVLAIVSLMVAIPIIIVFLGIGLVVFLIAGKIGAIAVAVIGIICLLAAFLAVRSIYEVFAQTVWIMFFHKIAKPKVEEAVIETVPEKVEPLAKAMPIIDSKQK